MEIMDQSPTKISNAVERKIVNEDVEVAILCNIAMCNNQFYK